jgi:hypothetical protein
MRFRATRAQMVLPHGYRQPSVPDSTYGAPLVHAEGLVCSTRPKKPQIYELWNDDEEFVWLWEGVLWGFKGCDMLGMASV